MQETNLTYENIDYELITAYVDNECNADESLLVSKVISVNTKAKLQFETEKSLKQILLKSNIRIITSQVLIDRIIDNINIHETGSIHRKIERNKFYKYHNFVIYPITAIFLIFISFYIFNNFISNSNKDFVVLSRDTFDKFYADSIKPEILSSDSNELQSILNTKVNFKVYIPKLINANLIGATVNEINNTKIVHIIHRRNNDLIYTMQANKSDILSNNNFILHKNHRQKIIDGNNWFPCDKVNDDCIVLWQKDDIICSSVSKLEPSEITSILTNYK